MQIHENCAEFSSFKILAQVKSTKIKTFFVLIFSQIKRLWFLGLLIFPKMCIRLPACRVWGFWLWGGNYRVSDQN